jgi:hypothetical protein
MVSRMLLTMLCASFVTLLGCSQELKNSSPPDAGPTTSSTAPSGADSKIEAAINELSEEDRALAKAQKFCAVNEKGRLGSMGKPYKIEIDGKPVFLCCDGCEEEAKSHPEKTLAKVEELKSRNEAATK